MSDTYRVIVTPGTALLREKASRFLAAAIPVETSEQAEAEVAAIRKRYFDATHHCTAWRLGTDGTSYAHDDGEPRGTAGRPILRQIEGRHLTNTLVVVTRYFGGTLLGTGGLVRAYGDAAAQALDACEVAVRVRRERLRLRFAYPDTAPAMHLLQRFDAVIEATHYDEATELVVGVRPADRAALEAAFTEALGGRGELRPL